jgi:PST family polysaccharide transporter
VGYWEYVSRGLTGALLRYSLVSAAIKVVCIAIGSFGGVLGVAIGYAVAPALSWPLSLWWLSRNTAVPTARLYAGAGRVLACAMLGGAAAWAACTTAAALGTVVQVAAAVVALALVYGVAVLLIPAIRRDLAGVIAVARLLRSR